jgi:pyridoxal phosphate enzyme (YggS family)
MFPWKPQSSLLFRLPLDKFWSVIKENVRAVLNGLPPQVMLVAAAKSRTPEEVREAVEAGVPIIGENYVQEAAAAQAVVGRGVKWHFIGHLQTNKVKKAVEIFDLIETVDSMRLAQEIDKRSREAGRVMPILIEVNSGRERQKFGVVPEEAESLVRRLSGLSNVMVDGLMTMGPESGHPDDSRPYFRLTKDLFERLKSLSIPGAAMTWLSMGMSHSYRVAIEEGANMVRLGTIIFGPRTGRAPRPEIPGT